MKHLCRTMEAPVKTAITGTTLMHLHIHCDVDKLMLGLKCHNTSDDLIAFGNATIYCLLSVSVSS